MKCIVPLWTPTLAKKKPFKKAMQKSHPKKPCKKSHAKNVVRWDASSLVVDAGVALNKPTLLKKM